MYREAMARSWLLVAGALACVAQTQGQTPVPFHQPFADNSIVLSRVGGTDIGTSNLSPASFAVALDEIRITSGAGAFASVSYAQTLYVPSSGDSQHTNIGNSKFELQLSRTTIGGQHAILFAGYDAPPGTTGVGTTPSNTRPRVVTSVTQSGAVDSTTRLTDAPSAPVTGAVSFDGATVYMSGDGANGRIRSAGFGATLSNPLGSLSQINRLTTHQGRLFASGGTSNNSIYSVDLGSGAAAPLPGLNAVPLSGFGDFFFAGDTTLYVAVDGTGDPALVMPGLRRYDFDGASWNAIYTIAIPEHPDPNSGAPLSGLVGLTHTFDELTGRVDVYATSAEGRNTRLMGITDYISNTLESQAAVSTLYTNPFSDPNAGRASAWRGVAYFPVPSPGAAWLLVLAAGVHGRRRR